MNVLFSADWHIKLGTKNIPNEFAINRYNLLFDRIHELEDKVDLHIIGGDIFDRLPTMEELELYFQFISGCKIETLIIPGNHEALKKNTSFLTCLKDVSSKLNPLVQIIDKYYSYEGIDFIPYNMLKIFEKNPKEYEEYFKYNILCTHVRGEIPPHVKPEIDLDLFDRWKVVLAGDLHSYANSQRNILYPGSPVTTSFHRNLVDTGVIIFDTDTLTHRWEKLDLPQLLRKTIKAGEELVSDPYHLVIYEVEGDMAELSQLDDHELLDKKVVKRDSDVALILDTEMSLEDEVSEYLKYILQVSDDTIDKAMKILNDNIKKT